MIETSRLQLRPWTEADLPEFSRVTNTPSVMQYLGGVNTPEEVRAGFVRAQECQAKNGFCFWIVERRSDRAILGFCGLKVGTAGSIVGEIEIGWRLREDAWGHGFARESASASLDWAWRNLTCERVVACTVMANSRSWGLMERLGMRREPEMDFEHPALSPGHPLRPHITYSVVRPRVV